MLVVDGIRPFENVIPVTIIQGMLPLHYLPKSLAARPLTFLKLVKGIEQRDPYQLPIVLLACEKKVTPTLKLPLSARI